MARRDWQELKQEFERLSRESGISLTQFCKNKGINRATASRHIPTGKQPKNTGKNQTLKQYRAEAKKKKEQAAQEEKHILNEKIEFFVLQNNLKKAHAEFIAAYFEETTIPKAAKACGIAISTAYKYFELDEVQNTISDISDTHYDLKITTQETLRGRIASIANANMIDFFNENGEVKKPHEWTRRQGFAVKEFKVKPTEYGEEITVKLYDAMHAAELLGKKSGTFEKPEKEGEEFKGLTDSELEREIEELEAQLERIQNYSTDTADSEPLPHPKKGRRSNKKPDS